MDTPESTNTNPQAPRGGNKVVTGIISVVVVLAVIVGIAVKSKTNSSTVATTTPVAVTTSTGTTSAETTDTSSTSSTPSTSIYKNGAYASEGSYSTPAGTEKVGVNLTLKDGVVTAATVVSEAVAPMSKRYQEMFISGFSQYVIGKSIADLKLSKVSGSSLTPNGFNDAVAKIKVQAQA